MIIKLSYSLGEQIVRKLSVVGEKDVEEEFIIEKINNPTSLSDGMH